MHWLPLKMGIPRDAETEQKIYHWNQEGGSTTWSLPASWNGVSEVKVFMLSDKGRTDMQTLPVTDGTITIDAKAKTPYVVYKGTDPVEETDLTTYDWSEGKPLKDTGFDSFTWDYAWHVTSSDGTTDHVIYTDEHENLISNGDTSILVQGEKDAVISQQMTGLQGGQTYDISVFAIPDANRKAEIRVITEDGTVYSNFATDNDSVYGSSHTSKNESKYQRIKVQVTIPEGQTTATLQLIAGKGSSAESTVRFDDVRVYPIEKDDYQGNYFFDDFEDFSRGFGVFENFISGPNHMSESSDFTDDVIDGRYSLKILNMEGKSQNMAQTVPSTLRFLKNTKCTVSVNYMVSNGGGYTLSAWEGETKLGEVALPATGMGQGANAPKAELSFTTGDTGKVQFRILTAPMAL